MLKKSFEGSGPVFRILVIKVRNLGDTLITSAALAHLYEHFAQLGKNVQVHWIMPQMHCELYQRIPWLKPWGYSGSVRGFLQICGKLLTLRFDAVIHLHASVLSQWWVVMARCAWDRKRVHVHHRGKRPLFALKPVLAADDHRSALERDLQAFLDLWPQVSKVELRGQAFCPWISRTSQMSEAPVTSEPRRSVAVHQNTQNKKQKTGKSRPGTVGLFLDASCETKRWPANLFFSLASLILKESDLSVRVFLPVAPVPGNFLEDFFQDVGYEMIAARVQFVPAVAIKPGSLQHLADAFEDLRFLVTNDTGPKHLGIALNGLVPGRRVQKNSVYKPVKVLTLFGPQSPREWHPYSFEQHPVFFTPDLSCRTQDPGPYAWCRLQRCTVEKHRCMRSIAPADVFTVIKSSYKEEGNVV